MKKMILTSPKYTGQITFGYSDTGQLLFYHNECDLDHTKLEWLLPNLPIYETQLLTLKIKLQGTLIEAQIDISFDAFWDAYKIKHNRKRAEPLYQKLSDQDKTIAILKIKSYQQYCANKSRGIADPEKYLRDRFFDTDWAKMP